MENERNESEGEVLADRIWSDYYKVKCSKFYFGRLAHRYWWHDVCLRLFLAMATFTGISGLKVWSHLGVVWEVLSGLAVASAVFMAVFNFQKAMYEAEKLEDRFEQFCAEYKGLMLSAELERDLEEVEQRYNYLMEKEELISIPARFKKYKKKLQARCAEEVDLDEGIQLGGTEDG